GRRDRYRAEAAEVEPEPRGAHVEPDGQGGDADDGGRERPPGPPAPSPDELDARRRRFPPPLSRHSGSLTTLRGLTARGDGAAHHEGAGEPVAHPAVPGGEPRAPQRDGQ